MSFHDLNSGRSVQFLVRTSKESKHSVESILLSPRQRSSLDDSVNLSYHSLLWSLLLLSHSFLNSDLSFSNLLSSNSLDRSLHNLPYWLSSNLLDDLLGWLPNNDLLHWSLGWRFLNNFLNNLLTTLLNNCVLDNLLSTALALGGAFLDSALLWRLHSDLDCLSLWSWAHLSGNWLLNSFAYLSLSYSLLGDLFNVALSLLERRLLFNLLINYLFDFLFLLGALVLLFNL